MKLKKNMQSTLTWFDANEKKPDKTNGYLIIRSINDKGEPFFEPGTYTDEGFYDMFDCSQFPINNVTHWCYFPEYF